MHTKHKYNWLNVMAKAKEDEVNKISLADLVAIRKFADDMIEDNWDNLEKEEAKDHCDLETAQSIVDDIAYWLFVDDEAKWEIRQRILRIYKYKAVSSSDMDDDECDATEAEQSTEPR